MAFDISMVLFKIIQKRTRRHDYIFFEIPE
jgi:hypothetical protein